MSPPGQPFHIRASPLTLNQRPEVRPLHGPSFFNQRILRMQSRLTVVTIRLPLR